MTAYVIAHFKLKDGNGICDKLALYRKNFAETLEKYGGQLKLRARVLDVPLGEQDYDGSVIIEFENHDTLIKWYTSQEYTALEAKREEVADVTMIICQE